METATSPAASPIPKAAAMLSPVPTATGMSAGKPSSSAGEPINRPASLPRPEHNWDGTGPVAFGVDETQ